MTLFEEIPGRAFREGSIPVLETKRLALRAPRLEDAKTVAMLANDRRIAENTARIPHPYNVSDAEGFITGANKQGGEAVFLITLRDETLIGACGIVLQDEAPGDRLLARRALLGPGLRHRGAARADRLRLHRSRPRGVAGRRPRHQPGLAPGAGEVRLPVDRRRPLPHPRHQLVGADRPLPARAGNLVGAEGLGPDETGELSLARVDYGGRRARSTDLLAPASDLGKNPPKPSPGRTPWHTTSTSSSPMPAPRSPRTRARPAASRCASTSRSCSPIRTSSAPIAATTSRAGLKVLYEDPKLGFQVLAHINDKARVSPPHDHGASWAIYGQATKYTDMTEWEREDNGSDPNARQAEGSRPNTA